MRKIIELLKKAKEVVAKTYWYAINFCSLTYNACQHGHSLNLRGRLRIRNRGRIVIGNHVTINSSEMANPLGGSPSTILVAMKGAEIIIGDHTGLSNTCIFARQHISIGDHVLLGAGVKIYDNDFHSLRHNERLQNTPPKCAPVTISSGAFVGAHSIILKGVTIGKNSVIGAGSVVTKSVPDGEVWAGNPAKFIRNAE